MPKIVDADARRQDVVQAVLRIIAVDGLERASLREVADEAGLAVGSVRHYFQGSEELLAFSFGTVVDRVVSRLEGLLPPVRDAAAGSPEQRGAVLTLLGGVLPLDEETAMDACAWLAFKNAARIRPFLAAEADRSHREVAAIVGGVVASLLPHDEPQENLVVEAERLLATLDGLCMHALLQPAWMTAQMCRDVLERHLDGLVR
ncbi:TetR family transcriptional regulator C-terminal domain-containing protein [Arthrobacter sp. FW306-05-C]|uniref:TetR/AcrR family transcriptional regulator n=1 Tax=unclassified Arthrobacter TaxID=235627 RepID=UPI001EF10FD0|nr:MULTISPECIES: TetR family transcriptional regulator C-terminal domain-containing protein [unclassified Arthrobacter]UKA65565.1 TetR family transcriptional regulator C-terminal domain-containing protein [Arthrobacter sp. FW306-05-C]UKA74231.1 TetR family transcriptional regulator C-terminal domain-containing protein [Arthrobacter sp. FW306-07-I]